MVLKTTTCRFSGLRIYPGRGILFVRTDGQQYLFINQKAKGLFNQRKRSAKIAWTTTYRKQHKKVRALAARAAALRARGA
jgi:large subunit ribosomal protein L24e